MEYRKLGGSGLKISELSFGSWVTFNKQVDASLAERMFGMCFDAGINFFDNAEGYEAGESEVVMGKALTSLGRPRDSYCVSSKVFFWRHPWPSTHTNGSEQKTRHRGLPSGLKTPESRLPGHVFLPPCRSGHAHRRDGLGHAQPDNAGQGAVLGYFRVDGPGNYCGT